jgi:hypothetical protein
MKKRHVNIRLLTIFVLLAFLNLTVGCRNYYRVNTIYKPVAQSTQDVGMLIDQDKTFLVHFAGETRLLKNIIIDDDKSGVTGIFEPLPPGQSVVVPNNPQGVNRYKKDEKNVLQEVHMHITEYAVIDENQVSIPLSAIEKIEVFDKAQGATIASWVFGIGSIVLGAYVLLVIIVLLTKESCPFIYEYNGEHYVFTGEIFSGAIQPWLERHDYLLLPNLKPYDDQYLVKVTNEIKEIQHINLMELMVIDHPDDVQVLVDKYGQLQTISHPVKPAWAETFSGADVLPMVSQKDEYAYYCDDAINTERTLDGLVIEFDKPEDAENAKLILRAKNSFWIEHVMGSFHGLFGRKYNSFNEKLAANPPSNPREWKLNQSIPVKVYIEKDGEWVFQDFFEIAGPMALKDDILSLDVGDVAGESVRVKLETGFLFWEIDYVAMDFSENIPLDVVTVAASEAIDEKGIDIRYAIAADDQQYYIQPEIGNESIVKYPVPALTHQSRTILLHSKGWYNILREQEGRADLKTLKTFREAGRLPQFSKELYEQIINTAQN